MNAVSLVWLAKTDSGWKRFPVVMGRNGRIKKGAVLLDGKERNYPEGHFELRFYEGRKPKYKNVGTDATEAVNACDRHQSLLDAKSSAADAGVTVNEPETRKTIKKAVAAWIDDTEDRGAMEAAEVNQTAMEDFQKANPALVYLDEIGPDSAKRYWLWVRKLGLSDRTVYNRHMRLTGFLKFSGVDYRSWKLRAPKYEKKLPDIYEVEEIEKLLRACRREYNTMMILILWKTGLRDQELIYLCWSDINLHRGVLRVTGKPEFNWTIKDYEQRDLPLSADLLDRLKVWRELNPKAKLVLGTRNGTPNYKLLRALKGIAKLAGIEKATLHRFRRTYCTSLLRGGVDLRTVQLLMGHSDMESTMRYLTPATGENVRSQIDTIFK
jgi:integrase